MTAPRTNGLSNGHGSAAAAAAANMNGDSSDEAPPTRAPMPRKGSNPLAPPFMISAPGKTIVYGEHAVVHGKAAIAASISLRSYLLCTTLTKSQRTVTLNFSDIALNHTWHIPDLPWAAFKHPSRKKRYYDLVTSLDQQLVAALQPHIAAVSPHVEPRMRKVHQDSASAFLYLFLSLGSELSPPCIYALRSTIPIAAGLGSSASVTVCMAAALLIQCRALAGPHPDQQGPEAEEQLERINRWAFVGEMLIHGNPSGVDNTVSTNGHAVLFQRKDYTKPPSVSVLRHFPELPLLLINTREPRSTATEVAKVARLNSTYPKISAHVLDAIDAITRSAYDLITGADADVDSEDSIRHLGELMTLNHGLLSTLGVSHPKLERLRHLVDESGVGWLKLTGAGGGGCAITLLKPEASAASPSTNNTTTTITTTMTASTTTSPSSSVKQRMRQMQLNGDAAHPSASAESTPAAEKLRLLLARLDSEGFEKYSTTLGGDGVGVLYPAVINDDEIDQDIFLAAEGREGVEELVGDREGEAWKYWRP